MLSKLIKIKIKNGAQLIESEIDSFLEELTVESSGLKLKHYTRVDNDFDIPLESLDPNGVSLGRTEINYDIDFSMNKRNYKAILVMRIALVKYETGIKQITEYKNIKITPDDK